MESKLALPKRSRRSRSSAEVSHAEDSSVWHAQGQGSRDKIRSCETLVIGGGIAGVSCAQELSRLSPNSVITLVSQTEVLREVLFSNRLTENLEDVSVTESTVDELKLKFPNISAVIGKMSALDNTNKLLRLAGGETIRYNSLCICTGAVPRLLCPPRNGIITIRDSDSVEHLTLLLKTARRAVVIGNGGIAMELAHELHCCETHWIIRDAYVGSPFFDATASDFVLDLEKNGRSVELMNNPDHDETSVELPGIVNLHGKFKSEDESRHQCSLKLSRSAKNHGSAVGPHLRRRLATTADEGNGDKNHDMKEPLHLYSGQEVTGIYSHEEAKWVYYPNGPEDDNADDEAKRKGLLQAQAQGDSGRFSVTTSGGAIIRCDCIVAAVGVVPNTEGCESLDKDENDALRVDEAMQTSDPYVFAAGDCCNCSPARGTQLHRGDTPWFQMRLWAQARVMGVYAAQCINEKANTLLNPWNPRSGVVGTPPQEVIAVSDSSRNDWAFHLFAHVTHFFGMKVVLLGRFNGQGLGHLEESAIKRVLVSEKRLTESSAKAKEKMEKGAREGQQKPLIDFASSSKKRGRACDCCDGDMDYIAKNNLNPKGSADGVDAGRVEIAVRVTPGIEYIKVVMRSGKVVGALLIGETDLEETFENLILNRIDVSHLGGQLLNPDHDLEDYFD